MGSLSRLFGIPPRGFAMVLHSEDSKAWCLQRMSETDKAFEAAQQLRNPYWQALVKRSCLNWSLVARIVSEWRASNWQGDPRVDLFLAKRVFSHFGATTPVEVAF